MNESKRTSLAAPLLFAFCLGPLPLAVGCDKAASSPDAKESKADAAEKADGKLEADGKVEADDASVDSAPSDDAEVRKQVAQFMKDQRKKGCEMLTPAMVAATLDVPEGELVQRKILGCVYSWEAEGTVAEASIVSIWVKETPEVAKTWFGNMTKSQTAEELAADMAKVKGEVAKREELDTKTKQKVANDIVGAAAAMMPDEGYQYDDVTGLGDAARVKTYDGSVTVLLGNMIFSVRAYKGDPALPPDTKAMMSGNVKAITAAAKKVEVKHMEATRDVRREMGVELAKAITAAL